MRSAIFAALFFVTLLAEFIANEKPLLAVYQGEWFFPVVSVIPETAFGGEFETEADYRDPYVQELIEVTAAYCGLSGADLLENETPVRYEGVPALTPDAYFLQQTFQDLYEEFLQSFELERISGRDNIVLPDSSARGFLDDVN